MSASSGVAQLYPQGPGSIFVAFYVSQGYGEYIITHLHTGIEYLVAKQFPIAMESSLNPANGSVESKSYLYSQFICLAFH
jgi:hypothetical protein